MVAQANISGHNRLQGLSGSMAHDLTIYPSLHAKGYSNLVVITQLGN
jgi:hypothetical protein